MIPQGESRPAISLPVRWRDVMRVVLKELLPCWITQARAHKGRALDVWQYVSGW